MSTTAQPASSPACDLFVWRSEVSIASNSTAANANHATDQIKITPDAFFCLCAFLGVTNYDNSPGAFKVTGIAGAAATLYSAPPVVPNNFEVLIKQDGQINLMGSPMPQGCICSNGYRAGHQLPYPILFPPLTRFDFDFYNVVPTLLKKVDQATAINLDISFGLYGYTVPVENLSAFCASWPEMARIAQVNQPGWLRRFTSILIPGMT